MFEKFFWKIEIGRQVTDYLKKTEENCNRNFREKKNENNFLRKKQIERTW